MSCTTPFTDPCGCQFQLDTKCVFYNSDNLTCLEVDSGSDLETILKAIDAKICTLNPETPIVYNVRNLDGTITVVPTGTNPRVFTVSLSGTFLNRITNIEGDITDIQDFINNLSFATTTPGMTGSVTGNVITVNYTNPTTTTKHGGIIYSNSNRTALAPSSPNGTGLTQPSLFTGVNLLDSSTYDLKVGEQLVIKATFELPGRSVYPVGSITNSLASVNVVTNSPSYSLIYDNKVYADTPFNIRMELYITCTSLNTAIPNATITGHVYVYNSPPSSTGTFNNVIGGYVQLPSYSISDFKQINWSNAEFSSYITNQAASGNSYNYDYSIELIKLF